MPQPPEDMDPTPPLLDFLLKLGLVEDSKLSSRIRPLARNLLESLDPQDASQQMLAVQMIATFNRSMFLTRRANLQKNPKWFALYSIECDRAMTLFRRQLQTFNDLRRPRQTSFTAIRQANIAGQQVVITPVGDSNPLPVRDEESVQEAPAALQVKRQRARLAAGKRSEEAAVDS